MLRRNNLVVATVSIALAFLAAIPMDWLTTSAGGRMLAAITGRTGHLDFPGVASLPIWLLLCGSAAVTLVAGLNVIRATAVPFALLATALAAGGVYYLLPFFVGDDLVNKVSVGVGAGPFVALAATGAALFLALRRPLPSPVSRPDPVFPRTFPARRR